MAITMDATTSPVPLAAPAAAAPVPAVQRAWLLPAAVVLALLLFPAAATWAGQDFYIGFASRVMIFVMAVSSLNLLVGYAGLVSLGHAAYFGFGAYVIAMLTVAAGRLLPAWATSAWVAWPLAMLGSALLALLVGTVALRTRQVYFIMITLAFSQMVYFLFIGMAMFGSDNGMSLPGRSFVGLGIDLAKDTHFFYVVLALLVAVLLGLRSLVRSRFGVIVQAIAANESRMSAIGFPVFRYKLACFVIAGAVAGLAGALLANQNSYVSPHMLDWTKSGLLLVMLILGGAGYLAGGIYGTVALLVLEEMLSSHTPYWQAVVGGGIVAVVVVGNHGIAGLFDRSGQSSGGHGGN